MKTVILCGGLGTRIRDVAEDVPKPLIRVGEYPILWHIMKLYAGHGFSDFVLCLGYKGDLIKSFFLDYGALTSDFTLSLGSAAQVEYHDRHPEEGWRVTLASTGLHAMTGARVRRVAKYLAGEPRFFLTYGDGVGDVDLGRLLEFHRQHGKLMTVTGVRPPGRFGELEVAADGRVTAFNEKPQASGGRISAGFFVAEAGVLEYLSDAEDLVLEKGPMDALVRDGQLVVYPHDGFWHPMDTHRDYTLLNQLWNSGRAPWMTW